MLAQVRRLKRMLDEGRYGSAGELAVSEKLERAYLGRILMLTLLRRRWWRRSWMGGSWRR